MATGGGPRVSMLVRNAFTNDSRVEKEARSLARAGYQVTVVAEGRPDLPDRDERDGYRVQRVRRGPARLPGFRMRQYRGRLEAAFLATRPDIAHAHDSDALNVVGRVARRRGIPFLYDAHELWLGQENRGRSVVYFALFRAWYWWLQRRLVPRAAAVITVSEPIARRLERAYRVTVDLVPNFPEIPGPVEPRDVRELLDPPVPEEVPVVLYLGNLQPGRGVEELVTALASVPAAIFVCLGVSGVPAALRALAAELGVTNRVRFLPPVPSDEVVSWAASATVGIALNTPISENNRLSLPNKLFQSMAAGIPVLASDFPHVRAIVEDSGAGICVDPTDPPAIADGLRRLLADPATAAAMGASGAAAIRDRYNWRVSEQALLAAYARIASPVTASA